jgi:hydroxyethylthiazole kinase-like uncharacterized protein yjeF
VQNKIAQICKHSLYIVLSNIIYGLVLYFVFTWLSGFSLLGAYMGNLALIILGLGIDEYSQRMLLADDLAKQLKSEKNVEQSYRTIQRLMDSFVSFKTVLYLFYIVILVFSQVIQAYPTLVSGTLSEFILANSYSILFLIALDMLIRQFTDDRVRMKAASDRLRQSLEMGPLLSVAQIQKAEQRCEAEYGIPLARLMDNAGRELAVTALSMLSPTDSTVLIFAGSGNNGGDGYVAARELLSHGLTVTVIAVHPDTLTPGSLVREAADAYRTAGGSIIAASADLQAIEADLVIDALLGTGLTRLVTGLYAHLIELINAHPAPVLACDLPSGVNADTGAIMGLAVQADRTLVLAAAKFACTLPPGAALFGDWTIADIGIPSALLPG